MNLKKSVLNLSVALVVGFAFVGCNEESKEQKKTLSEAEKQQLFMEYKKSIAEANRDIQNIKIRIDDFNAEALMNNKKFEMPSLKDLSAQIIDKNKNWTLLENDTYKFCTILNKCTEIIYTKDQTKPFSCKNADDILCNEIIPPNEYFSQSEEVVKNYLFD